MQQSFISGGSLVQQQGEKLTLRLQVKPGDVEGRQSHPERWLPQAQGRSEWKSSFEKSIFHPGAYSKGHLSELITNNYQNKPPWVKICRKNTFRFMIPRDEMLELLQEK